MSWDDTLGNMKTLDAWREQIGLVYEMGKPAAHCIVSRLTPAARRSRRTETGGPGNGWA